MKLSAEDKLLLQNYFARRPVKKAYSLVLMHAKTRPRSNNLVASFNLLKKILILITAIHILF
jgi:hypothetical protein